MSFDIEKIKQLYPEAEDLMIKPMLIHSATDKQLQKACESGDYFGQLKKDGALYQFVKTTHHSYLFGRTVSKKTGLLTEKIDNVPHIKEALSILPPDTILLGEIYYPGKTSKNVVEIMGCLPDKAIKRQQSDYGLIHFYIYDVLWHNGVNLIETNIENETRYNILKEIYNDLNLEQYDFLELAEVWTDNLYERIGQALAAGEEGMVLKKKTGLYEPDKRPATNLKAKSVTTFDAVIIGFEEPTKEYYGKELDSWEYNETENGRKLQGTFKDLISKGYDPVPVTKLWYYGWYNSRIKIGAYDKDGKLIEVGVIHSGISDEMKQDMTQNPDKYLNHACEIQAMQVDKERKTIRHGFFLRMRDDKDILDCAFDF